MTKQTHFRTAEAMSEGNKSLPFGIIAAVRAGFRRLGLYELFDSMKMRGVPLSFVIELMCIDHLSGGGSMNSCATYVDNDLVRDELCHGERISRKTMERALPIMSLYLEDVLMHIWERLNSIYPDLDHDTYVDGSHLERFGKCRGPYTKYGEGGGTIQAQDQFMLAQLKDSGLPIFIEAYDGNLNDPTQYSDFIPQLMRVLKRGSMIIMDNGGAAKHILDEIVDYGDEYLTRVKMNQSDIDRILNERSSIRYVAEGTACIKHSFQSSGRTTYLFFSLKLYLKGMICAERKAQRMMDYLIDAKEFSKDPKPEKLVTVKRNPFYKVKNIRLDFEMTLDPWLEGSLEDAIGQTAGDVCGWFKLQCSKDMDPKKVLDIYRHRSNIEHMISSIKRIVNMKPLRVWAENSPRGAMLLGLISQLVVSMIRYDLEPDKAVKKVEGKIITVDHKPSIATITKELRQWTVVLIPTEGFGVERIFTNETPLTKRISVILDGYRE